MAKNKRNEKTKEKNKTLSPVERKYGPRYKLVGYYTPLFGLTPGIRTPLFESKGIYFQAGMGDGIDSNKIKVFAPIKVKENILFTFFGKDKVKIIKPDCLATVQAKDFSLGSIRPVVYEMEDKAVFAGTEEDFCKIYKELIVEISDMDAISEIGYFLSNCEQFKQTNNY